MKLLKAEYNRRAQLRPLLWDNTLQLPLENVYTRLKIVSRRKADVQGEGNEVNVDDIFGTLEKGEDVMTLVEGSPGIGKTTFCLKLAYDWANENTATTFTFPKFELVLLLKCRDIDRDIMEAISEQLLPKDIDETTREKLLDFIKDIHNQERILIILDGLDELPQNSKHHVDELLHRRILPFAMCWPQPVKKRELKCERISFLTFFCRSKDSQRMIVLSISRNISQVLVQVIRQRERCSLTKLEKTPYYMRSATIR